MASILLFVKRASVSCLQHVHFSEEKMRLSRREVVLYILKIRSKAVNIAEVNEEKMKWGLKTLMVNTRRAARPRKICGPFSNVGL